MKIYCDLEKFDTLLIDGLKTHYSIKKTHWFGRPAQAAKIEATFGMLSRMPFHTKSWNDSCHYYTTG